MTHEQKPESAEFRTREAQIDGQIEDIFEIHEAEDAERVISKGDLRLMIEAAHKSAEARGAAEQRRKDAEGAEPVGWVDPEDVNPENTWCNGQGRGFRILEHSSIQTPTATMPLYTRPANVAALIAEAVAAERERCAKVCEAEAVLEASADPTDTAYNAAISHCSIAIREGGEG